MGFISKGISRAATIGIGVSSTIASRVQSPVAEKFMVSALARFLPAGLGDSLVELVDIIHKLFPELSCVDINTTLTVLAILHNKSKKPVYEVRQFHEVQDSPIAKDFAYFMKYATAAYGKTLLIDKASARCSSDRDWIRTHTGLPFDKIHPYIDSKAVSGRHMLEHYVAVDDSKKSVILALKGTLTIEGALKDVRSSYAKVTVWGKEYEVHGGN